MPEGPEVKLFVDRINDIYQNKNIRKINVLSGRYTKKPVENIDKVLNKNLNGVLCKGKFIWFDLGNIILFNTLGMTGSWSQKKNKHSRLEFEFEDEKSLFFNDIRNFGTFNVKSKSDLAKKLKSIGPDMLNAPPTKDDFVSILRKKNNKNICSVLMNQNIVSGIGNYIKAESLWYSNINPYAIIKDLTDQNLVTLYFSIIFVINKSYQSQGATIQSYYTFDNEKGNSAEGFVVYGRKTDFNGYVVIRSTTDDKRTTHWVKERQVIGIKDV